jgi:hypothetical protein
MLKAEDRIVNHGHIRQTAECVGLDRGCYDRHGKKHQKKQFLRHNSPPEKKE